MGKLTLRKSVTSVIVASTLALSVAAGITISHAHKATSNDPAHNQDGDETGQKTNPFENVNTQNVEKTGSYGLIDEYTITFDDGTTSRFIVINGKEGPDAIQAFPNDGGHTPTVRVGENGNWVINENDTGLVADVNRGLADVEPHVGENGNWWIGGVDTGASSQGQPGLTPFIGENGNWWIGETDTGVHAGGGSGGGQNGKSAYEIAVEQGYEGTVDEWLLTLVGRDGKSAYEIMQESGYTGTLEEWFESLAGQDGQNGENGKSAYEVYCDVHEGDDLSEAEWLASLVGAAGNGVASIEGPVTDGLFDTYTINYTDGNQTQFVVKNGEAGKDGSVTLFGDVDPDELQGVNGDSYINTQTWDYFVKEDNAWVNKGNIKGGEGGQGEQGQAGQNGKSIYAATGEPEADLGNVGDSYVNVTTGDYYVKDDTGWGDPIGSLKGANGAAGNGIASIALTDDTDATKDVYTITYTDTTTSTFEIAKPRSIVSIVRTSGDGSAGTTDTYTITYNYGDPDTFTVTHGSNGNTILTGEDAPDNSLGRPGDVYIDYVNQDIYLKGIDDWSVGISFKGADGRGIAAIEKSGPEADGLTYTYTITYTDNSTPFVFTVTNGAAGADGLKVVTGNALPTVLTNFQEGDSFIDTTNWNYYVLQSDGADGYEWDYRGNIRGTALYTGHIGDDAPTVEENYKAGDSYLNLDNWNYYVLQDNAGTLEWHLEGNIHNSPYEYEITFDSNGGSAVAGIDDAKEGHTITKPTDPTKGGYFFQGWYTVEGNKWDFSKDVVTSDITLYAHWAQFEVTDGVLTGCTATGDVIIPEYFDGQYIYSIDADLFKNKTGITSIALPNTVSEIADSSFEGCADLESFVMTNNVGALGENVFKGCSKLKYVYLSEKLTEISAHAFENCSSLKGISFPTGLETIGDYAFAGCTSLLAINFNDNLVNIGDYAFKGIGGTGWSERDMRYGHGQPVYPSSSQIENGVFYVDINTGDVYTRQNDAWRKGKLTITISDEWPDVDVGNYGDYWAYIINEYNTELEIKGGSMWQEANTFIKHGHGAPTVAPSELGKIYYDEDTEDLYFASNGSWTKGKISPFTVGNEDYSSHTYNNDYYIDTWCNTPTEYGYTCLSWEDGLWYITTLAGHGAPNIVYGEKYIDLDTGELYQYDGYDWCEMYNSVVVATGHGAPITGTIDTYYFDLDTKKLYYRDGKCLTAITLPDNLQTIGLGAFEGCNGLETITLPFVGGSYKNKGDDASFDTYNTVFGHIFNTDSSYDQGTFVPESLKKVVITKGNQFSGSDEWEETTMNDCRIPHGAFKSCLNIETIIIPETVTYIGSEAFMDCAALKNIIFEGQTRIRSFQDNTFNGCSSLESFVTPASVEYIKHDSFSNCTSLKYFTYEENSKINALYPGVFAGCSSLESYIEPDSCADSIHYICTDGNPIFEGCTSMKNMVIRGTFFVSTNNYSQLPYDMNATNRNPTSSDAGRDGFYWLNTSTYELYMYYGSSVGGSWEYAENIKTSNSCTVHVNNATNPVEGDVLIFVSGDKTTLPYYQIRKNGRWVNKNYRIIGLGWLFGDSSNYTLPDSLKSVTIGGNRAIDYKFFTNTQSIENIILKDTVTSISEKSFSGCGSLVSVTLSNSITSIPLNAFEYCYSLKTVVIPDSITSIDKEAFTNCTSLESIVIPDSVTSIGESAFEDCDSLKYVKLSNNLASLGRQAFYSCDALESLTIPGTLTSIGEYAFSNDTALKTVVISDGVTSIEEGAFYWCTCLEYVITPDTLESIGVYALSGCVELKSFVIPDGATYIGDKAFMDCVSLQSLVVPNSVTEIGTQAFEGTGLETLTIPFITSLNSILDYNDTLKTLEITGNGQIAANAFAGTDCPIETLIISGNQTIAANAFAGLGYAEGEDHLQKVIMKNIPFAFYYLFGSVASAVPSTLKTVEILNGTSISASTFKDCANIETILIPNSVTDIGASAFEGCSSLKNVSLPEGLVSLGQQAFMSSGLESIVIPVGIETIELSTFRDCSNLKTVRMTGLVTTIDESAFQNCSSLQSIAFLGDEYTHLTIGMRAFYNCTALETVDFDKEMTVDSLGHFAFSGCSRLYSFNQGRALIIEVEQSAFRDCVSLETIQFKVGLSRLADFAFEDCTGLMNVVLPEGLSTIYSYTFSGCTSLTNVVIPSTVTVIDDHAFEQCVSLSGTLDLKNVEIIRESAFEGCRNISLLIIDISVLRLLEENAFKDCYGIASIMIFSPGQSTVYDKTAYYRNTWLAGEAPDTSISLTGNEIIGYMPGQNSTYCNLIFR